MLSATLGKVPFQSTRRSSPVRNPQPCTVHDILPAVHHEKFLKVQTFDVNSRLADCTKQGDQRVIESPARKAGVAITTLSAADGRGKDIVHAEFASLRACSTRPSCPVYLPGGPKNHLSDVRSREPTSFMGQTSAFAKTFLNVLSVPLSDGHSSLSVG